MFLKGGGERKGGREGRNGDGSRGPESGKKVYQGQHALVVVALWIQTWATSVNTEIRIYRLMLLPPGPG